MKKLIPFLLAIILLSCTKQAVDKVNTCYICKWGMDTDGTFRPDFDLCTDKDWKTMHLFYDDRNNFIGGHCDKK